MKSPTIVLFLLFISPFLSAQYFNFTDTEIISCPSNQNIDIIVFKHWEFYQTENDEWDGNPVEKCHSLRNQSDQILDLAQFDFSKQLFIKLKDCETKVLNNTLFEFFAQITTSDNTFDFDNDASSLTFILNQSDPIIGNGPPQIINISFSESQVNRKFARGCYATNKYEDIILQDLYFSLKFSPTSPLNSFLSPISVSLDEIFYYSFLEQDVNVPEAFFDNGSYDIQFTDLFGFNSTTVVAHTSPGIPSPDNQSFINLIPEINRDFETPINLTVGEYTSIVFQEYSNLIGGLITNNDSIRHPLNIIMDGGALCMHAVEIISRGKSSLTYNKGDISFGKETDCLQFRDGGTLRITKNAEMHYGVNGTGMLNLSSGAKIIMEEGAKLFFDGTLLLKETSENHLTNESKINLVAGSQFIFSEHAKIISQNGNKKLNVYMNGGLLDLSNLDIESRKHLNLIFPEEKATSDIIKIFPTLSNGLISISNNSDVNLRLELINANGQRITDLNLFPWTIRQENISDFPNGVYFARFQIGKETYNQKIIKQ